MIQLVTSFITSGHKKTGRGLLHFGAALDRF